MCWHKYEYKGYMRVYKWLLGVVDGIPIEVTIEAKQCTKCGKVKEV